MHTAHTLQDMNQAEHDMMKDNTRKNFQDFHQLIVMAVKELNFIFFQDESMRDNL